MDLYTTQLRHLGQTIAYEREKRDLSQCQLARMVGLSGHAHISRVENGKRAPNMMLLFRLAEALDMSVSDLFVPMDMNRRCQRWKR